MGKLPTVKKKIIYPSELYEYLARKANSAIGHKFIDISFPVMYITFSELSKLGPWRTFDWLFERLAKSLKRISEKYGIDYGEKKALKEIVIDVDISNSYRKIIISGYHLIPINSFGKLLGMILWSYIVFTHNKKPAESEELQAIMKKYSKAFKIFRDYWNRAPREKIPALFPAKCALCGKEAIFFNRWVYKGKTGDKEVLTPVCEKHRDKII